MYNSTRNGAVGDDMPNAEALALRQHYYAAVSYTDDNIGTVMRSLGSSSAAANTVLALWGDHGWQLGEHGAWCKQTMWEIATRGTLLIRAPHLHPVLGRTEALVEFVDIYPTLVDLAGLPAVQRCPDGGADAVAACTDGVSLKPLWAQPSATMHRQVLSLYPRPNMNDKASMGYSMVLRVGGSQLRYTEWINISLSDPANQLYERHWDQNIGVELCESDRICELCVAVCSCPPL
jgi:iduronate 2-sulfatase